MSDTSVFGRLHAVPAAERPDLLAPPVLAAIGLVLPAALGVVPVLSAVAAVGVVLLMLGAAATHARRGETANIAVNVVLAAIAVFVAIERFGPHAL